MKRRDLVRQVRLMARASGVTFDLARHGSRHDVFRVGDLLVVVPRHNELNELTAQGILRDVQRYLGEEQP
jgi:mRNA interferase HicA